MKMDRSLFGKGPYPITGPLAVLARVALVGALLAIVVAALLPSHLVPQFVRSHYLQHFAAFYVAGLMALAALPRTRVTTVALRLVIFSAALEAAQLLGHGRPRLLMDNWVADLGGLAAALAPVWVARFRRRFERPPEP